MHVCKSIPFSVLSAAIFFLICKVQQPLVQPPNNKLAMSAGSLHTMFAMHIDAEIIVLQLKNVSCFIYRGSLFGAGFMTLHAHFGQLIFMKGSRRGS